MRKEPGASPLDQNPRCREYQQIEKQVIPGEVHEGTRDKAPELSARNGAPLVDEERSQRRTQMCGDGQRPDRNRHRGNTTR